MSDVCIHVSVFDSMAVPARCLLLLFDVLEQTWIGIFEPLLTMSARQVLDDIAFLDERQFTFSLVRTFPLTCQLPNPGNWASVTVMVVHSSVETRQGLLSEILVVDHTRVDSTMDNQGFPPSWNMVSGLPQVPGFLQFDWTGILRASCEPSVLAPLSWVQQGFVSRLPPTRLRECWGALVVTLSPETPTAREGRLERASVRLP
jgi:hypothetical protein